MPSESNNTNVRFDADRWKAIGSRRLIKRWGLALHRSEECGATMFEYALLLALIALILIAIVTTLGTSVGQMFQAGADSFP